jgi:hypothetical protein
MVSPFRYGDELRKLACDDGGYATGQSQLNDPKDEVAIATGNSKHIAPSYQASKNEFVINLQNIAEATGIG